MSMNHQTINSKPFPLKKFPIDKRESKAKSRVNQYNNYKKEDCKIKLMKFTLQEENLFTKEDIEKALLSL